MTQLSVNLNKIALLRNSRGGNYPDIASFAKLALSTGAAGVTIHPRPDQRHARYNDAFTLRTIVDQFANAELNIEGYPSDQFINTVLQVRPHQCTLVPDKPNQITSDHGWDFTKTHPQLDQAIESLQQQKIRVSLFIDPIIEQIELARSTNAERIELYTEAWAQAHGTCQQQTVFDQYATAAKVAHQLGFTINAGHDLNLDNLASFLQIPNIAEVSIGHALIVESLTYGFESTVSRYLTICQPSC